MNERRKRIEQTSERARKRTSECVQVNISLNIYDKLKSYTEQNIQVSLKNPYVRRFSFICLFFFAWCCRFTAIFEWILLQFYCFLKHVCVCVYTQIFCSTYRILFYLIFFLLLLANGHICTIRNVLHEYIFSSFFPSLSIAS